MSLDVIHVDNRLDCFVLIEFPHVVCDVGVCGELPNVTLVTARCVNAK